MALDLVTCGTLAELLFLRVEETNFSRCLMNDFTKSFDTADRAILMSKLARRNVSPPVINSILSAVNIDGGTTAAPS